MRSSVIASIGLHIVVILIATLGLPTLFKPPIVEDVPAIDVELVTISNETNVPTRPKEIAPPKEETKPEPPKQEPPKPAEVPPPPPAAKPEPQPVPQPQVVAPPEPKPEPKPELKPEEPKPEPKPQPPRDLANTKPTKKPKAPEDFDTVLKNLAKNLPQQKAEPKAEKNPTPPQPSFDDLMKDAIPANKKNIGDPSKPLTMTQQDFINNVFKKAMQRCWNIQAGAKDAADLVINVRIALAADGTVTNVRLEDSTFGKSDFWKAAADSAMRAVRLCSPYNELPKDLYDNWRDTVLRFDPKSMLGG